MTPRTFLLTGATLVAFAANSLLCRLALGGESIDPATFTWLRIVSGAVVLWPLSRLAAEPQATRVVAGSWTSALALFVYAITFSLAYVWLEAGVGALILFGCVQVTMLGAGLAGGERPGAGQWTGMAAAIGGLVYLVSPGLASPAPAGAMLMAAAGVAWGVYSLRGRGVGAPIAATAGSFARAVLPALATGLIASGSARITGVGALLAVVSGSITSGIGYVLWYLALRGLTTTRAAIVQLLVPVLAAFGGVVLLAEPVSMRLVLASVLILGGVGVAVLARQRRVA